jgi:hypothetical protein
MRLVVTAILIAACSRSAPTVTPDRASSDRSVAESTLQNVDVALLPEDAKQFPELEVTPLCSRVAPRSPLAIISWTGPMTLSSNIRLDVAVDPEGFARGEFITAPRPIPGAGFSPAGKLLQAKVLGRPFRLRIASAEDTRVAIGILRPQRAIVVEGLEPGVYYFLRLAALSARGWIPSPIVSIEAPTCPADFKERDQ